MEKAASRKWRSKSKTGGQARKTRLKESSLQEKPRSKGQGRKTGMQHDRCHSNKQATHSEEDDNDSSDSNKHENDLSSEKEEDKEGKKPAQRERKWKITGVH
eukprot:3639052-Ditylum_brightwellii.AAC.1